MVGRCVAKGRVDVIGGVVLLEPQDEAGVEAAVSGMFALESRDEVLCCFSQSEKGFFDRFQSVTHFGVHAMLRVFHHF